MIKMSPFQTMHFVGTITLGILLLVSVPVESKQKGACHHKEGITELCDKTVGSLNFSDTSLKTDHIWIIQPNDTKTPSFLSLYFEVLFLDKDDIITLYKSVNGSPTNETIFHPIQAQNGSFTLMIDETELAVKLEGAPNGFIRKFECSYIFSPTCSFTIPPEVVSVRSPHYVGTNSSVSCNYVFNLVQAHRLIPLFRFDVFNFNHSTVKLDGTTYPEGTYREDIPMDFFPKDSKTTSSFEITLNNMSDYFILNIHFVDSACSKAIEMGDKEVIESPNYMLDNGTFGTECVWVIHSSKILSVTFTKLIFESVLDIVAVNDGGTEKSPALYQVTSSNLNHSLAQEIRSSRNLNSGTVLWVSFKPVNYNSKMVATIKQHDQGGSYTGSGEIFMNSTDETVFLLEVPENDLVMLNFLSSQFSSGTLAVYDDFDKKNLIASLHGNVWYPVLSSSSRMMLVGTQFNGGSFKALFNGVTPGCMHMSSMTNENYILSGNCNASCVWIIPPQDVLGSVLLVHIQYISLEKDDVVEIFRLDNSKAPVGSLGSTVSHVPTILFPANVGALINVTRKTCSKKDDVILIGHSSFVPTCGGKIEVQSGGYFHITSPSYPDTYPLLANCTWVISSPDNSLVNLAFEKLTLAPNHCVKVSDKRTNMTTVFSTSELPPEDLFVTNGSEVEFSSSMCKTSRNPLPLVTSEGFMLNGTLADCGAVFDKSSSGEFTVNVSSLKQSLCMWKVSVPPTTDDAQPSVNVIGYTVTVKEDKGNYELKVYDGASIRDSTITNMSDSEIWSRSNQLIFSYKRLNISKPSSVFHVKYATITCNSSMLCANNICMHPDWRCNGVNECGDFTDEKNCASVPIPPDVKPSGYSSATFWSTVVILFIVGIIMGLFVPHVYMRIKNGPYRRFGDLSVIE